MFSLPAAKLCFCGSLRLDSPQASGQLCPHTFLASDFRILISGPALTYWCCFSGCVWLPFTVWTLDQQLRHHPGGPRNAGSQAPPRPACVQGCILTRSPSDLCARYSVRGIGLWDTTTLCSNWSLHSHPILLSCLFPPTQVCLSGCTIFFQTISLGFIFHFIHWLIQIFIECLPELGIGDAVSKPRPSSCPREAQLLTAEADIKYIISYKCEIMMSTVESL